MGTTREISSQNPQEYTTFVVPETVFFSGLTYFLQFTVCFLIVRSFYEKYQGQLETFDEM